MDNDTKLAMFMETLGDGVDMEVATSVLEMCGWDLNAAIMTMTGEPARASRSPAPTRQLDEEGYRAPMATGYTDTLMAPLDRHAEAALASERAELEAAQKKREDEQRAAAEKRRRQENEVQGNQQRLSAEQEALERRRRKREVELAEARLQANPEALRQHQERQQAEADAAQERQRIEEERQQREAAKAEAEALRKRADSDLQAKWREEKEQEDLRRERAECDARERKNSDVLPKEKAADEFAQALQALRKKYKDTDPAGLLTCLQTLRKYIDNLVRNPSESKFHRINCENSAFVTRVAGYDGATELLKALGFSNGDDGQLVVGSDFAKTKGSSLWDALAKFDVIISEAQTKVNALPKAEGA